LTTAFVLEGLGLLNGLGPAPSTLDSVSLGGLFPAWVLEPCGLIGFVLDVFGLTFALVFEALGLFKGLPVRVFELCGLIGRVLESLGLILAFVLDVLGLLVLDVTF
jgi:hypothetical protein